MQNLLEAFLFLHNEPQSTADIAKKLHQSVERIREELFVLAQHRNTSQYGIHVLHHEDTWQLVTAPEVSQSLQAVKKHSGQEAEELTRSSLETLAIIAYRGPLSRAGIEAIRGVNAAAMLRTLLMRGLILEHKRSPGVIDYTVSPEALAFLGVHSVEELPEFQTFHQDADVGKLLGFIA